MFTALLTTTKSWNQPGHEEGVAYIHNQVFIQSQRMTLCHLQKDECNSVADHRVKENKPRSGR